MGYDPNCDCKECREERRLMELTEPYRRNIASLTPAVMRKLKRRAKLKPWTNKPDYRPNRKHNL